MKFHRQKRNNGGMAKTQQKVETTPVALWFCRTFNGMPTLGIPCSARAKGRDSIAGMRHSGEIGHLPLVFRAPRGHWRVHVGSPRGGHADVSKVLRMRHARASFRFKDEEGQLVFMKNFK